MFKRSFCLFVFLIVSIQSYPQTPQGDEFQVNTYTAGDQTFPQVAAGALGNFVVVWHGLGTHAFSIRGQRYAGDGTPVGSEFQINSYTTNNQQRPDVADLGSGFVVIWQSVGSTGSDSSGQSIQGQRYASDGSPSGDEFQVNTYTTNDQITPQVAADSMGNFVSVWHSDGQDGDGKGVFGQRYDSTGSPAGGEFQVNTYATSNQYEPAVEMDALGNFVVIWQSGVIALRNRNILGQRYNAMGSPLGGEFLVNTYTTDDQVLAQIGMTLGGTFVVVWQDRVKNTAWSIQGQRFDVAGGQIGGEFKVDRASGGQDNYPAAAMDTAGNFVVVWRGHDSAGSDADISILGQQFDSAGVKVGGEFQVNSFTPNNQLEPELATDQSGNFVVVWRSIGSSGSDDDGLSIQGQRYGGPIPVRLISFVIR